MRLRRWMRPPRHLRTTRTGRFIIGLTIVVGAAAINTSNNLLFLILGTLFGLILASGIVSEWMVRDLIVRRHFPPVVFAGHAYPHGYRVQNPRRRIPAMFIEVAEVFPSKKPRRRFWQSSTVDAASVLFDEVGAEQQAVKAVQWAHPRRGVVELPQLRVSTRFPFDFYIKSFVDDLPERIYVAPSLRSLDAANMATGSATEQGSKPAEDEFRQLRNYVVGDPLKLVYWPKSTSGDTWTVREFDALDDQAAEIRLDPTLKGVRLEDHLSAAATRLTALVEHKKPVRLLSGDRLVVMVDDPATFETALKAMAVYPKPLA